MPAREFSGFDVDTIADAVKQPPIDDLWSAARARRRQRSAVVAVTVMVALISLVAMPLAVGPRKTDWAGPNSLPAPRDRATQLYLTGPHSGVGVETIDHGCTLRFTHTDDDGLTWTDWGLAKYVTANCPTNASASNTVTTEPLLEFAVLGQRSYLVRDGDQVQLSTDYGRTWRNAETAMVSVPAFPAKARPVYCQQGCGALRQPVAVDPSTGTVYRLSGKPPSPYPPISIYPSPDGAIWVAYWPGEIDRPMLVARSADRGASWNSWEPAVGANVIAVVGVNGQEGYLLIEPSPPAGAPQAAVAGPSQLMHTTDGGVTWTDVGTDLPTSVETRSFTVGSDGSLLIAQSGHSSPNLTPSLLVSRDGGRHFTKEREYSRLEGGVGAAPGYAWLYGRDDMSTGGADHVMITSEGSSWTRFALPN